MSPQVSSVVPSPPPSVPQTVIPNWFAASMSKDAFLRPVVINNRRLGSGSELIVEMVCALAYLELVQNLLIVPPADLHLRDALGKTRR